MEEMDTMAVTLTVRQLKDVMREAAREGARQALEDAGGVAGRRWLTVSQAAEHYGCSEQTIRNWIDAGAPARTMGRGGKHRIRFDEFDAWVDQHRSRPKLRAIP